MPTFPKDAKTSFFHRLYPRKNKQLPPSQKTGETAAFPRRFFCNITLFHKKNTIMKRASESFPPSASCPCRLAPCVFLDLPVLLTRIRDSAFLSAEKTGEQEKKRKNAAASLQNKRKMPEKKMRCTACPGGKHGHSTDTARTRRGPWKTWDADAETGVKRYSGSPL